MIVIDEEISNKGCAFMEVNGASDFLWGKKNKVKLYSLVKLTDIIVLQHNMDLNQ